MQVTPELISQTRGKGCRQPCKFPGEVKLPQTNSIFRTAANRPIKTKSVWFGVDIASKLLPPKFHFFDPQSANASSTQTFIFTISVSLWGRGQWRAIKFQTRTPKSKDKFEATARLFSRTEVAAKKEKLVYRLFADWNGAEGSRALTLLDAEETWLEILVFFATCLHGRHGLQMKLLHVKIRIDWFMAEFRPIFCRFVGSESRVLLSARQHSKRRRLQQCELHELTTCLSMMAHHVIGWTVAGNAVIDALVKTSFPLAVNNESGLLLRRVTTEIAVQS